MTGAPSKRSPHEDKNSNTPEPNPPSYIPSKIFSRQTRDFFFFFFFL